MRTAKQTRYDVIWWWSGGRTEGRWRAALMCDHNGQSLADRLAQFDRIGYVAIPGRRSIGAPDGPPAEWRFEKLGL